MSSFSRQSPESTPSAILHEAMMASVSSVRDSLPKEHHKHFETLRQEIIDFAASHDIPREALAKPDLLLEAANKLPTPDLERLAILLERFQHLIIEKKPWTNKEALEYGEEYYHLEKQYTSQVALLEKSGILKEGVITGIDNKKYPIPTLEQIAIRLFERRKELETKHDQGFTKLLLVPFGMSLDTLREILKKFLISYKQSHPAFNLDTNNPLLAWEKYQGADIGDSPKLVYEPQSFTKEGHGGKTKTQMLKEQDNNQDFFPGWTVHLLQPSNSDTQNMETPTGIAPIPCKGEGTPQGDLIPRPPLEAGHSSTEYLSILQKAKEDEDSPYHNESGLTPEDWIVAFMIHLSETGKPLDNYVSGTESTSYLTGAFFPSFFLVSFACWNHVVHQVNISGGGFDSRGVPNGSRFSVKV